MNFNFSTGMKKDYLETKPTETAKSNELIMKAVDEYETLLGKNVYDFSTAEIMAMLGTKFKNTSYRSVAKNVSIIKKYVDFCILKGAVSHMENRLATLTKDDFYTLVPKYAMKYKFISKDELRKYQDMLCNAQDKLLLELPFIGVRGRTLKGASNEEIVNLQIDPQSADTKNNVLKLEKNNGEVRYIQVAPETMQLVLETYNQEFYISNNGVENMIPNRKIPINKIGNYVFRIPGDKKMSLMKPALISTRMIKIQNWVGNKYLSIYNLYMSGMVDMAIEIYKTKGEVTKEDYKKICDRFDYGGQKSDKYAYNIKDIVDQYITTME